MVCLRIQDVLKLTDNLDYLNHLQLVLSHLIVRQVVTLLHFLEYLVLNHDADYHAKA